MTYTIFAKDTFDEGTEAHYAQMILPLGETEEHTHDFYEIFLINQGNVVHWINGKKEVLSEGCIVFIRPEDVHYYEKNDENECHMANLAFLSTVVEALSDYLGEGLDLSIITGTKYPRKVMLSAAEKVYIKSKLDIFTTLPVNRKNEIKLQLRALLVDLFLLFNRNNQEIRKDIPDWLEDLRKEVEHNKRFVNGVSVVFEHALYSKEHVSRTIKKHFGITPTQWINKLKINYASNLLRYTDIEIIDVAFKAGFNNLSHFYQIFKKEFSMPPHRYRSVHKKSVIP